MLILGILEDLISFFNFVDLFLRFLDVLIISMVFDLKKVVVFVVINNDIYIVYNYFVW